MSYPSGSTGQAGRARSLVAAGNVSRHACSGGKGWGERRSGDVHVSGVRRASPARSLTLLQVGLDVLDVLDADAETDEVLCHAAGRLFLVAQLLVRRRGRVNDERLCVSHVGQIRRQLERINKGRTGLGLALDTKRQHTTKASLQVLFRQRMARVALQARVANPGYAGVLFEVLGNGEGIVDMSLHTQTECLDALEQQECAKGVQGRTKVSQQDDADVDGIRNGLESVPELEAVVALGGLGELGKLAARMPVKLCREEAQWA